MSELSYGAQDHAPDVSSTAYVNVVGAAISFAILIGMLVWGTKTMMRDATGIPVVQALEGPSRESPVDPGGVPASHQGLAVNQVSSSQAETVASSIQLAPGSVALIEEDQPIYLTSANRPVERANPVVESQASVVEEVVAASAPASAAAPVRSLRPQRRPAVLAAAVATTPAALTAVIIPAGTRLAQLGAYPSQDLAEREWTRLSRQFQPFLAGKTHVVQKAEKGGKTFFRLRVRGFDGAEDARRFCATLNAQNAACYPVVMK